MSGDSIIKRLQLLQVIEETTDARTFILEPLDGWQPSCQSGQFLTLVFYTPHGEKRRSFSITSSPELNEPISITVKKVDNGEFSRPLVYSAKPGDIFYCSGISGVFTLPPAPWPEQFCFLAAGSGIAPCFSLIRTILHTSQKQVVLFYSNVNEQHTIFYKQLLELQQKHAGRFHVRFLLSENTDIYHKRLSRWLLDQLLDEYIAEHRSSTLFYLCGPFEYMQTAEITLLMHTDRDHLIKENFSSLPRLVLPTPPDTEKHRVTIHINQRSYILDVEYPQTVLKAAKEQRIDLPYSCEAGRCSSCVATCTEGKIWMAYNEILTDSEVEKGRILTCQSFPIGGDAVIRFDI